MTSIPSSLRRNSLFSSQGPRKQQPLRKLFLDRLKRLQEWVDKTDDSGEESSPPRLAEVFVRSVASEITRVLDEETFTPPGSGPLIPHEFILFLSFEDDREWRGLKRQALERALAQTLRLKCVDLFRGKEPRALSFAVELRVDGTLPKGQFRVKACWDAETDRTTVKAHSRQTSPQLDHEPDDITLVRPQLSAVLYSLEIWRDGERQMVVPVTKNEFTIGRGSSSIKVDLRLAGGAEMSRLHLCLGRDAQGLIWLTAKGQAPVFVGESEAPREVRTLLVDSQASISTCGFEFRIHSGR